MTVSIANAGAFLKDKDGNVGKVVGLSANDVTLVNNTISSVAGLDTRVTDAVNSIASVKETADAAKTAADEAKSAADSAKTAADEAKSAADDAKSTANSAAITASNANTTATEALTSAGQALTNVSTVSNNLTKFESDTNANFSSQNQTITRIDTQLTETDATASYLKLWDEDTYWPMIRANKYKIDTVIVTETTESGTETYRPVYATVTAYGAVQLMEYDEENSYNNAAVPRSVYDALEKRVQALESKVKILESKSSS